MPRCRGLRVEGGEHGKRKARTPWTEGMKYGPCRPTSLGVYINVLLDPLDAHQRRHRFELGIAGDDGRAFSPGGGHGKGVRI